MWWSGRLRLVWYSHMLHHHPLHHNQNHHRHHRPSPPPGFGVPRESLRRSGKRVPRDCVTDGSRRAARRCQVFFLSIHTVYTVPWMCLSHSSPGTQSEPPRLRLFDLPSESGVNRCWVSYVMTFETCNATIESVLCLILELAYLRWVEAKAGRLTFTVKPHLLRGLVLDPYTGWFTGFPEVQGSGTFEVSVANTLGLSSGVPTKLSTPRWRVAFSLCSPSASSSPHSRRLLDPLVLCLRR